MLMKFPGPVQIFVRFRLLHLCRAGQFLLLNGGIAETLYLPNAVELFCPHKSKGTACLARAPCSSNAVNIVLYILGKIIVDDRLHVVDVDAPGGHIRGNEDIGAPVPETVHGHIPLVLGHVAVKSFRLESCLFYHLRQLVHLYLGIAEDQAEFGLKILQKPDTGGVFVLCLDPIVPLRH